MNQRSEPLAVDTAELLHQRSEPLAVDTAELLRYHQRSEPLTAIPMLPFLYS